MGKPAWEYLEAQVAFALSREDMAPAMQAILKKYA